MSGGKLTMTQFLRAVDRHGVDAREALLAEGWHHKVILRKAEKAAGKGYTDYGVCADRPWLLDEGRAFLGEQEQA